MRHFDYAAADATICFRHYASFLITPHWLSSILRYAILIAFIADAAFFHSYAAMRLSFRYFFADSRHISFFDRF
jgi:hypothetical protein